MQVSAVADDGGMAEGPKGAEYNRSKIGRRRAVASSGKGKTEKSSNPDRLMLYNFDVNGDQPKIEHKEFLRREAFPLLREGGSVRIVGLTDRKGSDAYNQALSERRVANTLEFLRSEISSGFNVKQSTGFGETKAKSEGEADNTLNERFRAVLLFLSKTSTPPPETPVLSGVTKIVVKSYIAVIGSRIGYMPSYGPEDLSPALLIGLAKLTDSQFSEDPRTVAKDKHYRLYSACDLSCTWSDGKLLSFDGSAIRTDGGKEGFLQPPPLIATPIKFTTVGSSIFTFSWSVKGKPHEAAEPAFQAIRHRYSVYIWHTYWGMIDVSSGVPMLCAGTLKGSKFPSHRVFVDGRVSMTLPQNEFTCLWDSDLADRTRVK